MNSNEKKIGRAAEKAGIPGAVKRVVMSSTRQKKYRLLSSSIHAHEFCYFCMNFSEMTLHVNFFFV